MEQCSVLHTKKWNYTNKWLKKIPGYKQYTKIFGTETSKKVNIWKAQEETEKITLQQGFHVCTVHQQYQSTFLLIQLMHTIIKSQER